MAASSTGDKPIPHLQYHELVTPLYVSQRLMSYIDDTVHRDAEYYEIKTLVNDLLVYASSQEESLPTDELEQKITIDWYKLQHKDDQIRSGESQ
jgi:hypothetical protein